MTWITTHPRIEARVIKYDDLTYILPLIDGCEISRTVLHIQSGSLEDADKASDQLSQILEYAYNAGKKAGKKEIRSQFREMMGLNK